MARYDTAAQTARHDRMRALARIDTHNPTNRTNHQENTMSSTVTVTGTVFTTKRDGSDALRLDFTPSGVARLRFQVKDQHRTRQGGDWVTDERKGTNGTSYYAVTVWGGDAERIDQRLRAAAQATGRARVTVTGSLSIDVWQAQDGSQRTTAAINASAVGVEDDRNVQRGGQPQPQPQQAAYQAPQGGSQADPWATGPAF